MTETVIVSDELLGVSRNEPVTHEAVLKGKLLPGVLIIRIIETIVSLLRFKRSQHRHDYCASYMKTNSEATLLL